jgi:hypothetical protein
MALPNQPQPNAFAPKPPMAPQAPQVNPYEQFRKQAEQRNQAQMQQQQNAMQRRFAQLGGGPSGAQIKMQQEAQRQGNEDLSNQIGSINAQEAQANQQQNQFQQQFGLEQTKALAGIDMARRQSALDEQGQLFNQAQAQLGSAHNAPRFEQEIGRYQNLLNNQGGFGDYYAQLQQYANPMLRRLQADPGAVSAQGGQV